MLAVCTSYCIDFLKRHMKCQHATVVTIQIYADLEGCIQPHHGVMDDCRQKVSECCNPSPGRQGAQEVICNSCNAASDIAQHQHSIRLNS